MSRSTGMSCGASTALRVSGRSGPGQRRASVQSAAPWGVDASSGLESSPGVKDPVLIRDFVEIARGR